MMCIKGFFGVFLIMVFNKQFIATLLLTVFLSLELQSQSAICSYKYRKRISFDPAQVAGPIDLTNFPAMIKITADNDLRTLADGGHVESTSGFDIIFTAADGVTLLNFQMEYYASAAATGGSYTAWVRIPSISTTFTTDIYMYYGNPAIVTDQSSTTVWSSYHGVWHLQNSNFNDNTSNGYNTTNNATTNQSPAFINDGRALSGTNQWLEVANTFPNLTTNFTMSGWIYTTLNTKAGQRIFCDDRNDNGGYAFSLGDGGTGRLRFYSRGSNPVILDGPANQIANNTWYYVTAVADITNGRKTIYVNGVQAATATFVNAWGTDNGNSSIGGEPTGSPETANRLQGQLDEIRVANGALSADWILTEYNNQNSPSTFYSITAEPYRWNGATNRRWGNPGNWLGGVTPPADADVIIVSTANQPTLNTSPQVRSLWMQSATTLSFVANSLSFRNDITNCGTISGVTGLLTANSTTHAQTQYLSGSGTFNLFDFTVNNTFATLPAVVLSKDVNVNGALALTSGTLYTTAANILALSNNATSGSGSAASFVSGPMSKNGATNFVYPVGKGTKWRRCAVTNISASDTYTAEYFNSAFTNTSPVNAPLNNISLVEYWQVNRAGAGNANLTLYWEDASLSGITNCADLTIARWNGASWDERPGTAGGTCSGTGAGSVITNAQLTAFSPFTFGSKLSSVNPLPVTLLSFTATPINKNKALIEWSTATEKNNDYFDIERTIDGINFEFVGKQKGNGNSNSKNNYSLIDQKPYIGQSYYRLKQVDLNGDLSYSPLAAINLDEVEGLNYSLFPNPNKGEFTIKGNVENAEVIIYNMFGQKVEHSISSRSAELITVNCSNLASGIYFVNVKLGDETKIEKLLIE